MQKKKEDLALVQNEDKELKLKLIKATRQKQSIDDFFEDFLGQFISEQTKKAYLNDLRQFFSFLKRGGITITHPSQIQGAHFQVYRDDMMADKKSSATINRKLVAIRSFIKWAMALKLIDYNPLDIVKLPKVQTESPTAAFDDHEVVDLLNAPDLSTKIGQTHRLVMHLLFALGLRRSELTAIKLGDIYHERSHIVLRIRGKGDKHRHLPLGDDVQTAIQNYLDFLKENNFILEQDDYLIQSSKKGKNERPMDGSTVYRIIQKYAKICGINKKVGPHSCRATAISHLLDTQKTPMRDVATFAGHANITTTERYDKRRENLDKSAAYAVNYHKKSS